MPSEAAVWWLRVALGDLAGARLLADLSDVPPRLAAYLAQQAAEKALKAVIALRGIEPPFTHDLIYLIEICPSEAQLHGVVTDVARLAAPHSVARYPALDGTPFELAEVQLLVRDASLLVDAVQRYFDEQSLGGTELAPA